MTTHVYGRRPGDFEVGDRVALAPWHDLWMRGVRFGRVTRIGRKWVHIQADNLTRTITVPPWSLRLIERRKVCDCGAENHPSYVPGSFVHSESCPHYAE